MTPLRSYSLMTSPRAAQWENSHVELVSGEPGGPERAWLESVRRQGELSQDQLAAAPPFRVAGLAMPLVEPSYLAGWSWESMTTHGRAEGATVHGEGVHEISLF